MPSKGEKGPSIRGPFLFALGAVVLSSLIGGCTSPQDPATQVFCAASLSRAVSETARAEGLAIVLNSGGSNGLVRQAAMGARADLLLLADDSLARKELVPKGYALRGLASNELVVIAPATLATAPNLTLSQALAPPVKIAVADAQTAPLGLYTKQSLEKLAPLGQRIPLQDATAVLSTVALGHVDRGIVYRTDALEESQVRIVCAVPGHSHRPVVYVAALPPQAPRSSQILVESLRNGKGKEILARQGFLPPVESAAPR